MCLNKRFSMADGHVIGMLLGTCSGQQSLLGSCKACTKNHVRTMLCLQRKEVTACENIFLADRSQVA